MQRTDHLAVSLHFVCFWLGAAEAQRVSTALDLQPRRGQERGDWLENASSYTYSVEPILRYFDQMRFDVAADVTKLQQAAGQTSSEDRAAMDSRPSRSIRHGQPCLGGNHPRKFGQEGRPAYTGVRPTTAT